jgi:5'-nucleotidase / UDP-sugar diphosphatase
MLSCIRGAVLIAAIMAVCSTAFPATVTSDGPLGTAGVSKQEVSLGDLVADAVRASLGADIGIVSASELKEKDAQIAKGKVTTEDIVSYVAYTDDPIALVKLSGKQIKQALERSVVIYPQKNLGFLQVSGIKFAFDPGKPPESRVTSLTVGGSAAVDSQTYTVAMTSSMANGALGYWKIWSKSDFVPVSKPITIPQALDAFLAGKSSINYTNLNRIAAGG